MLASNGNFFQWTPEHGVVMRSPERGQICENIAAALNSLQQPNFIVNASQELFEIVIHFYWLQKRKQTNKSCATNNTGRKEQYIRHSRLNHRHRQSTEVFECHKKTVTRKTSLRRRRRRLSGKHCLNFVFQLKTKTLGPVSLGCEASSSCV